METKESLTFTNPREWRDWLAENHDNEKGIWIIIHKKNSSKAGINYNQALEEALCYGWIDGQMKSIDKDTFILRFSPRKAKSIWSKINKENAEKLITSGKMTSAGLAAIEKAKKNGSWEEAYTNKVKEKIPTDLKDALLINPVAMTNFNNFANSYRNMYIGWITGAKTEVTRKKRINEVVNRSIQNKRLITD